MKQNEIDIKRELKMKQLPVNMSEKAVFNGAFGGYGVLKAIQHKQTDSKQFNMNMMEKLELQKAKDLSNSKTSVCFSPGQSDINRLNFE